jgi:hypothetical protein
MAAQMGRENQPDPLNIRAGARSDNIGLPGRELKKYLNWSERP